MELRTVIDRDHDMLRKTLLIFAVICFSKATDYAHVPSSLDDTLTLATKFFQKLKKEYESLAPSQNVTNEINDAIARYMEELIKPINQSRYRRQLNEQDDNDKLGIEVLDGFEEVPGSTLPAALDVAFFVRSDGAELQWLAATLDSSQISLLRFNGNEFIKISSYPLSNGTTIAADSSKSGPAILVVGKSDGGVVVLRLRHENHTTIFRPAQNLHIPGSFLDLTFWRGMNQLYLGLTSTTNVLIYKWLGEHFDRIQSLDSGASGLRPFKAGGSVYLAATATRTTILKFLLRSNEFVAVQELPRARDVSSFVMEKGHRREHYLVLSNENSSVLYKLAHDRFVPFQIIAGADRVTSMTTKETVMLTLLKGTTVVVYQYDGWKFVKLVVTMSDVEKVYPASLEGEIVLMTKRTEGDWKFSRLRMTRKSTWKNLREEVKSWCFGIKDQQKRAPATVSPLEGPVKILNGHVGKIHTRMVNGYNSDELAALTPRYEAVLQSTIALTKRSSLSLTPKTSPKFNTLHARKVQVRCASQCKAERVVTETNSDFMEKFVKPNNEQKNRNLKFENVRIHSTGSLPCPVPGIVLEEVTVSGLVNGISVQMLQDETLRITGDQEVRGEHIFANLDASSGLLPLGIAAQTSQQRVHATSFRVHDLRLTQGDYLLPLNGPPVLMSGPKTMSKVKVTGLVQLRAGLKGKGIAGLAPLTHVAQGPLELVGSYSLEGVDVVNTLTAGDLMGRDGNSLRKIANAAVPIRGNVPSHLILSAEKVAWTNVTIRHLPKWVTLLPTDSKDVINITGAKYTPHNLTLTRASYDNLPLLRLQGRFCAEEATMSNIRTTGVALDRSTVQSIRSEHVWGATDLNDTVSDTVVISQNLAMASKKFVGILTAKNASFTTIPGIDFEELLESMVKWIEPALVVGHVEASNLTVTSLFSPNIFKPALTGVAKDLRSKVNLYVARINNVNVSDFIENVVKIDDTVSLADINFAGGVVAKEVHVFQPPVNLLLNQETVSYLGSKTITGNLQLKNLVLSESLVPPPVQQSANLIVKGSAVFAREPMIENINGYPLNEVFEKTWMVNKPTVLSNALFEIRNMVLEGPVQLLSDSPNSPTRGSWIEMSRKLLSKTKAQEINAHVSLAAAKAPNIIGNEESTLQTPPSFSGESEWNFLRKHDAQRVTASMRFLELKITGDLDARSTINDLNLATGVVRNDVERNIVTGKKIIASISAQDVHGGLNFEQWSRNALSSRATDKPIVVKGRKHFRNLSLLKELRVQGSVMGCKIEDYLLKSSRQRITGRKTIVGSLTSPKVIMDGLINDVNVTSLVEHQLKKNNTRQTVRTGVILRGDFRILGDFTIDGLYRGVELRNLSRVWTSFEPVVDKMTILLDVAEGLDLALRNRARYFDKLEEVENSMALNGVLVPTNSTQIISTLGRCEFREGSLFCDNAGVNAAVLLPRSSEALLCKVVTLEDGPLVVLATSDPHGGAWIYSFDTVKKAFHKEAGLHFYGATQASAVTSVGALWLAIQLPHNTVIIRYEPWGEYEEYILPGSGSFHMETEPGGQLLIVRSDGVWGLGGLEGPHQIFKTLLNGVVDTFTYEATYFMRITKFNDTSLLKARYVGN